MKIKNKRERKGEANLVHGKRGKLHAKLLEERERKERPIRYKEREANCMGNIKKRKEKKRKEKLITREIKKGKRG